MEIWVVFTLLAAFMQSIRTAGQKKIARYLSPMAATLVRYLFGLPFVIAYLLYLNQGDMVATIQSSAANSKFIYYASAAGVAQIMATVWLVKILSFRNFAVGTCFAKTEAIQTAVLGVVLFNSQLPWLGWLAVIIGVLGIVAVSLPKSGEKVEKHTISYGLLSGIAFAFASLWIREASLSLGQPFQLSAAVTLTYMVSLQTLLCLGYIVIRERVQLINLCTQLPLAIFVGATSAAGSVGWFTAMTYQNAALVKSLGQIEFVFTLLLTYFFFQEKISRKELWGMGLIIVSVILLLSHKF